MEVEVAKDAGKMDIQSYLEIKGHGVKIIATRRDKIVKKEYVMPDPIPVECKICHSFYSPYNPKNIFGGFCFNCDCDAYYEKQKKLSKSTKENWK